MSDIEWIMFSKHRTLQALSCASSLCSLSEVRPEEITVLYVDSGAISYEPLKKQLPCRFIKQTNFYKDFTDILRNSSKPLVGFMVDDLIFRERLSCRQIESLMSKYKDLDCFSLRLGRNIRDARAPAFEVLEPGVISWKTAKGLGKSWNYFWEVSGSVYRKEIVLDYLEKLSGKEISFPNPLEFHYYKIMPNFLMSSAGALNVLAHPRYWLWSLCCPQKMAKRMACYERSRAFTQGVNLVASRNMNYNTHATPEELHELFLRGYRIDFQCLKDVENTRPNAGRTYFRIVGPQGDKHPLSVY